MKLSKTLSEKEVSEIIEQYDIRIHRDVEEDGTITYYAYFADIGVAPCSNHGDTREEAIKHLMDMALGVFIYHRDNGLEIPNPTKSPFFMSDKELDEWVAKRT